MALQNRLYQADSMQRREFTHWSHVHIKGNAKVDTLVVAGDLTVDGTLQVENLYCLGKLTVGRRLQVGTALLGSCAHVGGAIQADDLEVGTSLGAIGSLLLGMASPDEAQAKLLRRIHPRVLDHHAELAQAVARGGAPALEAASLAGGRIKLKGGFLICGAVDVGAFEAGLGPESSAARLSPAPGRRAVRRS